MKVALGILVALAAAAAVVVFVVLPGDPPPRYKMVFDNAFGLTPDTELRAAGVTVGNVDELDVDRKTARAVVTVSVQRQEFGRLRTDAFCRVQPQSLIGEYFVNCEPGEGEPLEEGATLPVEQTGTTIPPDLVQNILRRPWRERLGIILNEFGAGFAARGDDLDAVIQRAVPALRDTNRVLRILAEERRVMRSLIRNGDTVLLRLARNRGDVSRFVSEARDTARASANRRVALAQNIDRLPPFLRGLRPTLRDLEKVARRQTPALRDLRASAPALETLFQRLGPFSEASRPAIRSLGRASVTGRRAVREARSTVSTLRVLGRASRDPLKNLRFVLEHLTDRKFAVEDSPIYGGRRLTGLEAILQYPFVQSQAINIFDNRGYMLKLNALINECTAYTDGETAREKPERTKSCSAALGPSSPGINDPDPSPGGAAAAASARRATTDRDVAAAVENASGGADRGAASEDLADFLLGP